MINPAEVHGLNVVSVTPPPHMDDVNANTNIQVQFDSDLNTRTIFDGILILRDVNSIYKGLESLKDLSSFEAVEGNVSYKDKTVTITPNNPLIPGCRYIIYVKPFIIKDILGRDMLTEYVSMFFTESFKTNPGCILLHPTFGTIAPRVTELKWEDQEANAYVVQVSKTTTFEHLHYDTVVTPVSGSKADPFVTLDIALKEGLYYWRVRSLGGDWSEPGQFFIKYNDHIPVSHADEEVIDISDEEWEEALEVLEVFPEDQFSNVATNLKIIYVKVSGIVKPEDIRLNQFVIEGTLVDEDDDIVPHEDVNGTWTIVNDSQENVSYLIFTLDTI